MARNRCRSRLHPQHAALRLLWLAARMPRMGKGGYVSMNNGTLDSLVEELNRILVQAEAEVYTRQKALDEAKKEAQQIRAMLRAAGALETEPKVQRPAARPKRISEETRH